jgi:hypothetical protein
MIRVLDHEMNVEWELCVFADRRDHRRAKRNVIDEVAIHDVEMKPIGAGFFSAVDLGFETGEIGCEDGRSDEDFPHEVETFLRKATAGKLSNVLLYLYRFLCSLIESEK